LKKDLARFIALLENEPDKKSLFTPYFIFERSDGKWSPPSGIFLDEPFMHTGLHSYYDALGKDAKRVALAESYKNCSIAFKKLGKFAEAVGAQTQLEIMLTTCFKNPEWPRLSRVGGNQTYTSINHDYVIAGLEKILTTPSLPISKLIWQCMRSLPLDTDRLKATYQNNKSTGYRECDSTLVYQLRSAAWVPQGNGIFVRPAEGIRDLLPEGFSFDSSWQWLKAIGFEEEAAKKSVVYRQKQTIAEELGYDSAEELEKWQKIKELGISPDDIIAQYAQRPLISQPEDSVQNPTRRQEKLLANIADAPSKESVTRERAIQKGISEVTAQAKAYLRARYKNRDEQLVCQCCHGEMPFKLRSNEYYFEAVQCISDKEMRHFQNRLALCPNCAAKYQYARETEDADIRRCIIEHEADDQASSVEIPVRLAGRELTLRFVVKHWLDLKTILSK
jgi:phage gp36-like protein